MNKRGPKPSGVETDVLYKRVPKAEKKVLVEMVDAAMSKTLKAWSERNHEYLKKGDWYLNQLNEDIKANGGIRPSQSSNGLESKGNGVGGPIYQKVLGGAVQVDPFYKGAASFKELADVKTPPITQDHLPLLKRIMELESQLSQMTASYEGEYKRAEDLVIDLGNAKDELEQVAGWTEDDKTKYWRNRALVAEATMKGRTNEFDQG